ncbi:hypothetical protein WR25_03617 [Diploscapter pachys]|uniref:Uncharacterized protein n=1 Tax=Diploscapter pachys TaxID=2018661 RepID=A0A2A2J1D6_9BILA|nr:hypothetical protein WR25_03617 [Diploscapter pachys]
MAQNLGINHIAARSIVIKDLKLQNVHNPTPNNMVVRVQRCKQLLQRFSAGTHSTIVFSDEKLFTVFTVEAAINRQNDRIIAPDVSIFHLNAYSVFTAKNILSTILTFHCYS